MFTKSKTSPKINVVKFLFLQNNCVGLVKCIFPVFHTSFTTITFFIASFYHNCSYQQNKFISQVVPLSLDFHLSWTAAFSYYCIYLDFVLENMKPTLPFKVMQFNKYYF